jgi:protein O-mannosyl-transferase
VHQTDDRKPEIRTDGHRSPLKAFMSGMPRRYYLYLLALLVIATYLSALGNGFVWDDTIFTIGNPVFKNFDLHTILFGQSNGYEYLPLRDITCALDYLFWGENPAGFHLTNIVITVATALVGFFLAEGTITLLWPEKMTQSRTWLMSFATAALFILHPVQAQAINWISCRNHLLAGLFCLLSLLCTLKALHQPRLNTGYYLGALLFFVAALLSKVTAIILPVILLSLFFCLPEKRTKAPLLPFFALAAFYYFFQMRIAVVGRAIRLEEPEFGILSIPAIAAKAVAIPFFYLGKYFIPRNFSAEYEPIMPRTLTDPAALAAIVGLLVLICLALGLRKRFPLIAWGILFYLLGLLPVLNIFPTHPMVADRYLYLPSFGLALAVTGLVMAVPIRGTIPVRPLIAVPVIALLVFLTHRQNAAWHDEERLWLSSIESSPGSSRSYANLGSFYFMRQNFDKAFPLFEKAAELDPSKPNLEFSRGIVEFRRQAFPEALVWFRRGLDRNEYHLQCLYFSGLTAMKLNQFHPAAVYFRKMDDSPEGDSFGYRRKRDGLTREYIIPALKSELDRLGQQNRLNPGNRDIISQYVELLYSLRMYHQVIAMSNEPGVRDFLTPAVQRMIGNAFAQEGNRPKAKDLLELASGGTNPDPEAPILLARLHVREHDFVKAVGVLQSASGRGNAEAAAELGGLFFRLGKPVDTVTWLDRAETLKPAIRTKVAVYRKKLGMNQSHTGGT